MESTDKYAVLKRRIVWSLDNFKKDTLEKYKSSKIISDTFSIFLQGNKTIWKFSFYPSRSEPTFCELYLNKLHVDSDDFKIKLTVSIKRSDKKMCAITDFELKSKEFKSGFGSGRQKLMKIDELVSQGKEYVNDKCLIFVFDMEFKPSTQNQDLRNRSMVSDDSDYSEYSEEFMRRGLRINKNEVELEAEGSCENEFTLWNERYFNSKVFSDFTLVSSDEVEFPVHRCILAVRSKALSKMLNARMVERKSNKMKIKDVDGDTMKEMLRFIYSGKAENLETIAYYLISAAEKFSLPELKLICCDYIISKMSTENIFEQMILADNRNLQYVMKECLEFIKTNYNELRNKDEWENLHRDNLMEIIESMSRDYIYTISLKNTL